MTGPCQCGFTCPYQSWSLDGDYMCAYPYLGDESRLYPFVDEIDCPLTDVDSELHQWMIDREEGE